MPQTLFEKTYVRWLYTGTLKFIVIGETTEAFIALLILATAVGTRATIKRSADVMNDNCVKATAVVRLPPRIRCDTRSSLEAC